MRLQQASRIIRSDMLGQDRFGNRYYALDAIPGVVVERWYPVSRVTDKEYDDHKAEESEVSASDIKLGDEKEVSESVSGQLESDRRVKEGETLFVVHGKGKENENGHMHEVSISDKAESNLTSGDVQKHSKLAEQERDLRCIDENEGRRESSPSLQKVLDMDNKDGRLQAEKVGSSEFTSNESSYAELILRNTMTSNASEPSVVEIEKVLDDHWNHCSLMFLLSMSLFLSPSPSPSLLLLSPSPSTFLSPSPSISLPPPPLSLHTYIYI